MINSKIKFYKSFASMKRKNNLYLVPKIKYKIDKKIYNLN